jgi:pimeloyl-ACP methyl ester carboxylesterase
MPFMPFNILGMWFRGLLSIAILAGGIYLLRQWYEDSHVVIQERIENVDIQAPRDTRSRAAWEPGRRVFRWEPGWNRETRELAGGLALLVWAVAGQFVYGALLSLMLPSGSGGAMSAKGQDEDPKSTRDGTVQRLRRPDGSEIQVECYGPPDAPPIVLTHGWGVNSTEWYYVKKSLTDRFRIIVWDLPGLGLSKKPDNNDFRLEKYAADLDAVLAATTGGRPAVVAGHSIGGMITLTFCRLFPEALGSRVAGIGLVHTTYTDPVKTTRGATIYTAIETPVLVPLMYLTIALWPLVWLLNWMSYLNGSVHRSTHKQSFAGHETRGQLDFAARFILHDRPDILARGMLAMMKYDATATLATIPVPAAVIPGDRDTTCLPEASAFMANAIPRAELISLTPARHMGLIEKHAEFDRALAGFASAQLQAGTVVG